jgi:hypothetical protein
MGGLMRIPKAPSWQVVFLFAACWNSIVERSWWATGVCLALYFLVPVVRRIDNAFSDPPE